MLEAGGVCCLTCAVLRTGLFWPWVAGDGRVAEGLGHHGPCMGRGQKSTEGRWEDAQVMELQPIRT